CKRFCLRHGRTVVVILGVLGVVALGLGAFTGLAPGTETVTEERNAQTITAETDVSAIVGPGSSLWEEGTRLENRPAYVLTESPAATINATIGVSDGTFADVDPSFRLEYRAVRDEETIWNESVPLETAVERGDDGVAAGTTVNVSAVAERIRSREEDVGRAADVRATIVLKVPYETEQYDDTITAEFPLKVDGEAYELDPDTVADRQTTPMEVEQPADPDVPLVAAFLLLGGLGLAGAAGAYRAAAGPSSAAERLELEREIEHARYAEWISVGEFPADLDHEYVRLESLDDLVNLAIDTNGRVIYDREREAYAVVTRDVLYYVGDRSEVVPEWQFGAIPDLAEIEN
ncbi:MAG: DUF5305 family protein, partial [Halolamina sp.]